MESDKRKKIVVAAAMMLLIFAVAQLAFDSIRDVTGAVVAVLAGISLLLLSTSISRSHKERREAKKTIHSINGIESTMNFMTIGLYVGVFLGGVSGFFILQRMNYSLIVSLFLSLAIAVIFLIFFKVLVKGIVARRVKKTKRNQ